MVSAAAIRPTTPAQAAPQSISKGLIPTRVTTLAAVLVLEAQDKAAKTRIATNPLAARVALVYLALVATLPMQVITALQLKITLILVMAWVEHSGFRIRSF